MINRIKHFFYGVLLIVAIIALTPLFYCLTAISTLSVLWECGKDTASDVFKTEVHAFHDDIKRGFYRAVKHFKWSMYGTTN